MSAVDTHPLWRPYEQADLDEVARVRVGARPPRPVEVVAYDAGWPAAYQRLRGRVVAALGDRVLALEHVGSTAVPGLAAKPVIDADLAVADPSDESTYVPALEAAGFALSVREPGWEQHRVLTGEDPRANLHVFGPGAREPRRHVLFRDWLRENQADRAAYGALKTQLAGHGFADVMDYNNHKGQLVHEIYERAFAADPDHPHTPRAADAS